MTIPTLVAAILLALIHLIAGKLRFLSVIPRSRWLSLASGVSIAYVFLHLLPELERGQDILREATDHPLLEQPAYLAAMVGLALFYGLERMVKSGPKQESERAREVRASNAVFWVHIGSFAVYNLLLGYLLLHREEPGLWSLTTFTLAIGLHFLVNDYGLNEHHEEAYGHRGRWVIAVAILLGWGVGYVTHLEETITLLLTAFLAGGIILNVLKEELPEDRKSNFGAFAVGVIAYSLLLLTSV